VSRIQIQNMRHTRRGQGLCGVGGITLLALVWAFAVEAAFGLEHGAVLFSENFEAGLKEQWVEQGFPSITRRNVFWLAVESNDNHYLKVKSVQSYSAKGVHLTFSPKECPHVSWRWRITNVVEGADLTRKDGDDAAAKLYVVFDGPSFWKSTGQTYPCLPVGQCGPSGRHI